MPPSLYTIESVKMAMQRDLKTYFGYNIQIETRNFPCWVLTAEASASEKLRTKSLQISYEGGRTKFDGFIAKDLPISSFLGHIWVDNQDKILLDETGIKYGIDIDLTNYLLTDFESLRKGLLSFGLHLDPAERPMKVLVIHDPQPATNN